MHLRCGERFIASFLENMTAKELWKSANI